MYEPCGSIQTELGILKAYIRNEPDYPGIDIRLERGGKEIFLAWAESIEDPESDHVFAMRMYGDCKDDEPTHECRISSEELDVYFKEA